MESGSSNLRKKFKYLSSLQSRLFSYTHTENIPPHPPTKVSNGPTLPSNGLQYKIFFINIYCCTIRIKYASKELT